MKLLGLSSAFHFKAQRLALRWAKENLPKEKYQEIHRSYHTMKKRTTLFILVCCLPIIMGFTYLAIDAPISKRVEAKNTPQNATDYVLTRVDYDGNFYWTYDSQKYEHPLANYGLSPDEYEFGDELKVYVDNEQNVIQVTNVEEGLTVREMEVLVGLLESILVPILLLLCVYMPIAYYTFGKPWREFCREFNRL